MRAGQEKLSRGLTRMFDEICKRQARLMSEWLRVGYCQVPLLLEFLY